MKDCGKGGEILKMPFLKDSTFLDYVRGGLKVNMVCALDMSKSSASLHRFDWTTKWLVLMRSICSAGFEKERTRSQLRSGRWRRSYRIMIMISKFSGLPSEPIGNRCKQTNKQIIRMSANKLLKPIYSFFQNSAFIPFLLTRNLHPSFCVSISSSSPCKLFKSVTNHLLAIHRFVLPLS